MSGEGGEKSYYCAHNHLVLITAATGERVRGVYCRECRMRVTVYLSGRDEARKSPVAGGGVQVIGNGDPAHPPIETKTINPGRGVRSPQ